MMSESESEQGAAAAGWSRSRVLDAVVKLKVVAVFDADVGDGAMSEVGRGQN